MSLLEQLIGEFANEYMLNKAKGEQIKAFAHFFQLKTSFQREVLKEMRAYTIVKEPSEERRKECDLSEADAKAMCEFMQGEWNAYCDYVEGLINRTEAVMRAAGHDESNPENN